MKAEHRKELQTNSLADALGRTVRGVRGGSGFSWFWFFMVFIVLAIAFGGYRWYKNKQNTNAENWARIDINSIGQDSVGKYGTLLELLKDYPNTVQGRSAELTLYFAGIWIGMIPNTSTFDAEGAKTYYANVKQKLTQVADDSAGYPDQVGEARYLLAVATETMAMFDAKYLDDAKAAWKDLAKPETSGTAWAILAKKRADQFDDPTERAAIARFYTDYKTEAMEQERNRLRLAPTQPGM
jgi:hypothetical protein